PRAKKGRTRLSMPPSLRQSPRWLFWWCAVVGLTAVARGCDHRASDSGGARIATDATDPRTAGAAPASRASLPGVPVAAAVSADDWFEDVTDRSGVSFAYRNGAEAGRHYILESLGGGVALFDYDNDGDLDLFCAGGGEVSRSDPVAIRGRPPALFRNEGLWRFVDVTKEAGLAT